MIDGAETWISERKALLRTRRLSNESIGFGRPLMGSIEMTGLTVVSGVLKAIERTVDTFSSEIPSSPKVDPQLEAYEKWNNTQYDQGIKE